MFFVLLATEGVHSVELARPVLFVGLARVVTWMFFVLLATEGVHSVELARVLAVEAQGQDVNASKERLVADDA